MQHPTPSARLAWVGPLAILCMLIATLGLPVASSPAHATGDLNLVQYVNPFIGTDTGGPNYGIGNEGGHVFPGADYPHGLVQWSPDTTNSAGGYRYGQPLIRGFSLTHFSGRGCDSYQDFPFMPALGPITTSPAGSNAYAASFSHSNESASPGYYSVRLNNGIGVALTVTPRTGYGTFTYPSSDAATLLINAGGSATGDADTGTGVQVVGNDVLTGSASSGNFCGNNAYTIYFAATFDHPFTSYGTWNGGSINPGSRSSAGSHSGAYLAFNTTQNRTIGVKVGISFVSIANAQANLAAENPGWDVNATRSAARAAWNAKLNEIQVAGGSPDERTSFYTALYHTLIHPNVFSDVNGQYIGFDKQIHTAQGYTQYENFPGWDMYRSLSRLRALLDPSETGDMMQSLVADAQQGGGGLPRWEVANDNSGGMIGDSQDVVIATSYAFGATHFDTQGALRAMLQGASQPSTLSGRNHVREGLADYLSRGYVPIQATDSSAAITLEYASDDFAIAQFARALGDNATYATYLRRAQNWKNLFNPATGYVEPRNADGSFIANFDPTSQRQFREGDAAQYTWLVPFNLRGLFDAMGGPAKAIARLDTHFTQLNAGPGSLQAFMGNEPEFEVPWEYDFAGAPSRTEDVVRRIETELFHATPGGLVGNDDGGALSSWYVFAAIGLYPEIPGVAGFVVGSPLFPDITVRLAGGKQLRITAQGGADNRPYVQSLFLNDRAYDSPWIPFSALASGATLRFTLGATPATHWGIDPAKAPPSFDAAQASPPVAATPSPGAAGLPSLFDNAGVSDDSNRGAADFDGQGFSYSAQALRGAGLSASQQVAYSGLTFQWPNLVPGTPDNVVARGQTVTLPSPIRGGTLGFLGAASQGPSTGTGTIHYADGTTQSYTLGFSDWTLSHSTTVPSYGNGIVATMSYRNGKYGAQSRHVYIFYASVPLRTGTAVVRVTLPNHVSQGRMHLFAMAVG